VFRPRQLPPAAIKSRRAGISTNHTLATTEALASGATALTLSLFLPPPSLPPPLSRPHPSSTDKMAKSKAAAKSKATKEDAPPPVLNEYAQQRADKIAGNNAKLVSLGLMSKHEEKVSNLRAQGIIVVVEKEDESSSESDGDYDEDGGDKDDDEEEDEEEYEDEDDRSHKRPKMSSNSNKKKKKRKASSSSSSAPPSAPSRVSLRLRGQTPNGMDVELPQSYEEVAIEREARVVECREARLRAAVAVGEEGYDKAAQRNKTVTYEHAAMRVRTMTEKALLNRIKVIEKACGKDCILKLAIFKCCLQDSELWVLATEAGEALERLKGEVEGEFK
jgi:hypothetical protein